MVKKPTITETIRLHRLRWFGYVQRMEENRIPKRVLSMKLEATRPRGRPRNRWQDEVREDGRIVGGEELQGKVYDREEWKNLLRTARNAHANGMNEYYVVSTVYFGMKLYNDQRNANDGYGVSARVSPDADTIPRRLEPLPKLNTCL
jgi:hypothetical protein